MMFSIPLLVVWVVALARVTVGLPVVEPLAARATGFETAFGTLTNGTSTVAGVQRFVVRYATAARWKASVLATSLHILQSLPPVCPQVTDTDSGAFTGEEDCLYLVVYVPTKVIPSSVIVWIHGGSLIVGGANDPMIDGSKLALATQSVVAVMQYRLGVLGFLPPVGANPNSNLGVRDAITALTFVNKIVSAFGGNLKNAVTVAGQSSGATMIRALLAAPSASALFSKAILQSDTADYGFFKPTTITTFQKNFFPSLNCSVSNASCQSALSLGAIMSAQNDFLPGAPDLDAASAGPLALRPVIDNQIITTTLTTTFPSSLKPLLITTVKNEAGPTIFGGGGVPQVPNDFYAPVLESVIPDSRAQSILNSTFYALGKSDDAVRDALMEVVTDLAFRCPDWALARAWSTRGGSVFLGKFLAGATHPSNDGIDFCTTTPGAVCHQDDIPIVFGTARNPSAAQKQLIADTQARFAAFVRTGNPNLVGQASRSQPAWLKAKSSDSSISTSVQPLGGSGPVDLGACVSTFWGSPIAQFDYQIHGL
ncbi:alpha/beta-hydrolase [Exidia glandulosa HHB12029]|uniref:Alpha/beta-hydrolase n=1 Tax=Exidia glandulosa HHB12029 TaxID=1314781 RepID=A0A165HZC8_EXIGL|nr:alpha/beta-hydrolase [Exidia glandulosa HHB12029]